MTVLSCTTCRHAQPGLFDSCEPDQQVLVLECRRYPPTLVFDDDGGSSNEWPCMSEDDWCGEWTANGYNEPPPPPPNTRATDG